MTLSLSTVIWDFDGTLLPFDTEQALLRDLASRSKGLSRLKRPLFWLIILGDQKGWFGPRSFKAVYLWCLRGMTRTELTRLTRPHAVHIPQAGREAIRHLHRAGLRNVIISCGTRDIIASVLEGAELRDSFQAIRSNRLVFRRGRVADIIIEVPGPEDKIEMLTKEGIDPGTAAAVGDGYTDVPVLDLVAFPILLDRHGREAHRYAARGYRIVSALSEVGPLLVG